MNTTLTSLLASEWHTEKNSGKTINDFSPSSGKKVWWRCVIDSRHEWEARIFARAQNNQGCPFCKGKKVLQDNSLGAMFPELLKDWDYTKNLLDPFKIACKSGKKVSWKCQKGHEWVTSIIHRTNGTGCPYCANQRVDINNCFAITHSSILKEWHYERNQSIIPFDFVAGSKTKVWWQCCKAADHEWIASIYDRAIIGTGCPCCAGRKIVNSNCLATTHPTIAKEWHPTKNSITPFEVTYASNKKVWFQCLNDKSHEWYCKIYTRTRGDQCPYCASSKGEKVIKTCLERKGITFKQEYRIPECKNIRPLPFDFAVLNNKSILCLIEYQGIHHYEAIEYFGGINYLKKITIHDNIKKEYCKYNNIKLLIIPYWDFDKIETIINSL